MIVKMKDKAKKTETNTKENTKIHPTRGRRELAVLVMMVVIDKDRRKERKIMVKILGEIEEKSIGVTIAGQKMNTERRSEKMKGKKAGTIIAQMMNIQEGKKMTEEKKEDAIALMRNQEEKRKGRMKEDSRKEGEMTIVLMRIGRLL